MRSSGVAMPQQTNKLAMPPDAFGRPYRSRKRGTHRAAPPSPTLERAIRGGGEENCEM
jgi:hypothetical protein